MIIFDFLHMLNPNSAYALSLKMLLVLYRDLFAITFFILPRMLETLFSGVHTRDIHANYLDLELLLLAYFNFQLHISDDQVTDIHNEWKCLPQFYGK